MGAPTEMLCQQTLSVATNASLPLSEGQTTPFEIAEENGEVTTETWTPEDRRIPLDCPCAGPCGTPTSDPKP